MYSGYAMPHVRFIAEQDGVSEKELKTRLVPRLKKNATVVAAYLVRVVYGDSPDHHIALALDVEGTKQGELVEVLGREFREMFRNSESLDILFLSEQQRAEIAVVAKPFFFVRRQKKTKADKDQLDSYARD